MNVEHLIVFLLPFSIQCEKIIEPTLKPAQPFSANQDGDFLKKELQKKFITDRTELGKMWFHRTYDQRNLIKQYYEKNFCQIYYSAFDGNYYYPEGCPLNAGLSDASHDDLDDLYQDSLLSSQELLGRTVFETIMGKCTEVGAIEEIVCGNDKEMKDLIAGMYKECSDQKIEDHLATFKADDKDYQHVMLQYCWKGLCQENKIKPEDAAKEAQALRAINPDKDKDGFKKKLIELLDKNCEPDLKLIFEKYRNDKDGISDAVDQAFDRDRVKRAYNRLVRSIEDTCRLYADELHHAVKGRGTDTDKINRIILTRCERDLGCVLKKYKKFHKKKFLDRLLTDTLTQPRYRHCIGYLCGE